MSRQRVATGVDEQLMVARTVNRELAHLLIGIAVYAEGLQRKHPMAGHAEIADGVAAIAAEAWRGFAAADRAEARFRSMAEPAAAATATGSAR